MLWPNIDAAIGVRAKIAAASSPGTTPAQRRTIRYMTKVAMVPSMTCGKASDQG